jgi:general secretion pathway protein G
MPGKRSVRAGFTVVELVIAVLIVGILSAIAIPNYLRYLEKNKEATAISDINTIAGKLKEIMMENPDALPPDLATINVGNYLPLIDPWGNPYRYLPLYGRPGNLPQARRDHNLVPINSDFDLYSMGPDGLSAKPLTALRSRDDIIRANDGAFIGKASTYDP